MSGAAPAGARGISPWRQAAEEDRATVRVVKARRAAPGPLWPGGAEGCAGWEGARRAGARREAGRTQSGARTGASGRPRSGGPMGGRRAPPYLDSEAVGRDVAGRSTRYERYLGAALPCYKTPDNRVRLCPAPPSHAYGRFWGRSLSPAPPHQFRLPVKPSAAPSGAGALPRSWLSSPGHPGRCRAALSSRAAYQLRTHPPNTPQIPSSPPISSAHPALRRA